MRSLSVVIPALNEVENIPAVMASIPVDELARRGWATQIVVVDNGSTDGTRDAAAALGARVVHEPVRGYGNAYRAGLAVAEGEVIATGDADLTYPFEDLPRLLEVFEDGGLEFMTTDRLSRENRAAMKFSHLLANHVLSALGRVLLGHSLRDSQSGMWLLRSEVWDQIAPRVTAPGMAFSQEIKFAAALAGFRFAEVPIEYRERGGRAKLNALGDGVSNLCHLFALRVRSRREPAPRPVRVPKPTVPADAVERV